MSIGLDNLEIYKLAERLEIYVYKITKKFPIDEKYRSVDQLRRSSSSVSDNIAEGYGRYSFKDKINRFYIARAEAEETRKGIKKGKKKGFVSEKVADFVDKKYTQLIKQINAYINFLRHKFKKSPGTQLPNSPGTQSFTLIEMAMVITIIGILALVALAHYRAGGHQMELSSAMEKLADIIKEARSMALSGKLVDATRPNGYGVYLQTNSYTLFADLDDDKIYDPPPAAEKIQTFDFVARVTINSINPACDTIIFTPPNAGIGFYSAGTPVTGPITITLIHSATSQTKTIIVNQFGQIDIPL